MSRRWLSPPVVYSSIEFEVFTTSRAVIRCSLRDETDATDYPIALSSDATTCDMTLKTRLFAIKDIINIFPWYLQRQYMFLNHVWLCL
jgi:hypothetical protein